MSGRLLWLSGDHGWIDRPRCEVLPGPCRHQRQAVAMSKKRKNYDREFRDGAVRIVRGTGKPIAAVARDLGANAGTKGNWVNRRFGVSSG